MNRTQLEEQVKRAFRDSQYPGDRHLVAEAAPQHVLDPEAEEVNEAFSHKKWQDVGPGEFICWPQAISFFTAAAFAYYLPAILLASLDLDPKSAYFTGSFIGRLTPGLDTKYALDKKYTSDKQSDFLEIIASLCDEQKHIIAKYFEFVTHELYGGMELGEAQIALERYWRQFL